MMLAKNEDQETEFRMSNPWPRLPEHFPIIPDEQGRCWHIVQSDSRHASMACAAMKKLGYTQYYPHMREMKAPALRRIHSGKRKELKDVARPVLSPLFPGNPFVLFNLKDGRWHELFELFGVYGMKVANGLPVPVSQQLITNIMEREIGGAIPLETPVMKLIFNVGDCLRVDDGPFRGFTGTIQDLDEVKRKVLLDVVIFGAIRAVSFEADQVSKI